VEATEIAHGRRRMLLVRLEDGGARLLLRFFHFGAAQQKAFTPGVRVRAFGEIRGMPGMQECVHPEYRILRGPPPRWNRR
jgi:ATP-dependent DNA helicase RecG